MTSTNDQREKLFNPSQWAEASRPVGLMFDHHIADLYAGLYHSSVMGMVSVVLLFDGGVGGYAHILGKHFLPLKSPFVTEMEPLVTTWRSGRSAHTLRTNPGALVDDEAVVAWFVTTIKAYFKLRAVVVDRWSMGMLELRLKEAGIPLVSYPMTRAAISPVIDDLRYRFATGLLFHGEDPILDWHVGNAFASVNDEGLTLPVKASHSSPLHIDSVYALCLAAGGRLAALREKAAAA